MHVKFGRIKITEHFGDAVLSRRARYQAWSHYTSSTRRNQVAWPHQHRYRRLDGSEQRNRKIVDDRCLAWLEPMGAALASEQEVRRAHPLEYKYSRSEAWLRGLFTE